MSPYASGRRWALYLGDVLEVAPLLAPARFGGLVTDPPYAAAGGNTNGRESAADDQYWVHWFRSVWTETAGVLHPAGCGFVFCDWRMVAAVQRAVAGGIDRQTAKAWQVSQALVWDREAIGLGKPFRAGFEMIAFVRGPDWQHETAVIPNNLPAVVRHRFPYGAHEHHGAEKPVALLSQFVAWTGAASVFDPFAGSGSCGVACLGRGVAYTGIEREEPYAEIAARRLEQAEIDGVPLPLFGGAA